LLNELISGNSNKKNYIHYICSYTQTYKRLITSYSTVVCTVLKTKPKQ